MAKTVAQLMADAQKLIEQAKELEKQNHARIGQQVMRLYDNAKLTDKSLITFIDKLLGKSIDLTDENVQSQTVTSDLSGINSDVRQ
jgi:hypothetical protein